jgi:hypothetical protein
MCKCNFSQLGVVSQSNHLLPNLNHGPLDGSFLFRRHRDPMLDVQPRHPQEDLIHAIPGELFYRGRADQLMQKVGLGPALRCTTLLARMGPSGGSLIGGL